MRDDASIKRHTLGLPSLRMIKGFELFFGCRNLLDVWNDLPYSHEGQRTQQIKHFFRCNLHLPRSFITGTLRGKFMGCHSEPSVIFAEGMIVSLEFFALDVTYTISWTIEREHALFHKIFVWNSCLTRIRKACRLTSISDKDK